MRGEFTESKVHEVYPVEEVSNETDLRAFFDAKNRVYGEHYPEFEGNLESDLRAYYDEPIDPLVFIIRENGKIIAGSELSIFQGNQIRYGYGWNKFVDPEYEGKGLAQRIDEVRSERAKKEGCKFLFGLVNRDRPRAIRSAELSGFKLNHDPEFEHLRVAFPDSDVYVKDL